MARTCSVTFTAGTGARRFDMQENGPGVTVGRSERAELYVNSPRLSRMHCALRLTGKGLQLEDLNSANGTFVNGQRIKEALLRPGDIIQVGGIAIRVDFDAAATPDLDLRCERCNRLVSMARCEEGAVFEMGKHFLCPECSSLLKHESFNQAEQQLIEVLRQEGYAVEGRTALSSGIVPVFRARRIGLDTLVAVKALPLVSGVSQKKVARFQTEAKAAAKVRHPAVIEVYDIRHARDCIYIVMEHAEGELLLSQIERLGPLALPDALRLGLHVTRALVAAHKQGIVHRDLKPGGIVVTPDGMPKVADFGLAKDLWSITGNMTGPEETLGTVRYMPPEQVKNARSADHRADLYSLGATLFHALTGKPPYSGKNELELMSAVINGTLPAFDPTKAEVPPRLGRLLARAMAPRPEDRFQHASDLEAELGATIADLMGVPGFGGDPELLLRLKPDEVGATWRGDAPRPGGMSGAFAEGELLEVLQMIGYHKKTGVLTVRKEAPRVDGHLAFQEGRVRAAVTSTGQRDVPAALEIMSLEAGRFDFAPGLPKGFAPTIDQDAEALLFEAMRRRDESRRY
ncbi:MAG: protein kinase [Planctomycetota bacterium]|nr:protein kinase [Planctomycetota bacterium]